jgi:hypothetical protein
MAECPAPVPECKRDLLMCAPGSFILLVCFLLIADLLQFQRIETDYLKITATLHARKNVAFIEFRFFNIKIVLALWARDHNYLHYDFLRYTLAI